MTSKPDLTDKELRTIAQAWLDISEPAMAGSENTLEAVFIGATIFAAGRPMSLSELAKLPWVRNRTSAKRWCERLCYLGVAERTEDGVKTTKLGDKTGQFYFSKLHSLLEFAR